MAISNPDEIDKALPTRFAPENIEKKWLDHWDQYQLWRADLDSLRPPFAMVLPPPNITGVLHMGHALTVTIQDCIARYKRMRGFEVLWIPGLDHAGIATQMVVERDLWDRENKTRRDIGREAFTARIWRWKEEHQSKIIGQIKTLGASCDWSKLCFSLDPERSHAVHHAFKSLYDQGLIYRGNYLVNWDPVAQTALSDDEVEHEEVQSTLWQLRYSLSDESGESLVVATTRPETLLGDVALAVHPDDQRYRHLIGTSALVPLVNRRIPIIADRAVELEFGTGVVKITPAHDPLDYQIAERHQLIPINIIAEDGTITLPDDAAQLPYGTMSTKVARQAICADLEKSGHMVSSKPHLHRVGISYRSKALIEPRLSQQWFFKLSSFRQTLREAIEKEGVKLIPDTWRATYFHWVDHLKDWCISRQLWWGHRIPVWRDELTGQMICPSPGEAAPSGDSWQQDGDVLDTWFSSALWPMSALGWPDKSPLFDRFYPNTLLETGCDILFFWVARMAIMGKLLVQKWPFHTCYLHGLIYAKSYWRAASDGKIAYVSADERSAFDQGKQVPKDVASKWEKMSKSKQNVLSPEDLMSQFGVDATRLALITSITKLGQIDLDMRKFGEARNFTNKLWNAARFVLISLQPPPALTGSQLALKLDENALALEDRWMLGRLRSAFSRYHHQFDRFDLNSAAAETTEFFWNDFCSTYIEIAKPILQGEDSPTRRVKQQILALVLLASLRLLHPMIPFVTEELFAALKNRLDPIAIRAKGGVPNDANSIVAEASSAIAASCCMATAIPLLDPPTPQDCEDMAAFEFLMRLVRALRNLRAELQIAKSCVLRVFVVAPDESWSLMQEQLSLIESLVANTPLERTEKEPSILCSFASCDRVRLYMQLPDEVQRREKERIERELPRIEGEINKLKAVLSSGDFRAKAPNSLVKEREAHLHRVQLNRAALLEMLARLNSK